MTVYSANSSRSDAGDSIFGSPSPTPAILKPSTPSPGVPAKNSQPTPPQVPGLSTSTPPTPTPQQIAAAQAKADKRQNRLDAKKKDSDRKKNESLRVQDEAMKKLREQLKLGRLAICVGSGVTLYSAPSQAQRLSWWGLMSNALDYFEDQASTLSLEPMNKADIASARKILEKNNPTEADREDVTNRIQKLLANRIDLETTWMRAQFQNLYKDYVDQSEILDAIKALQQQGAILFTTNYDDLLERHCDLDGIDASDPAGLISWRRGSRPAVFHPHGYWRNANHIVLSAEQYWRVKNEPIIQETLQHVLGTKTVLFVGCGGGLADPNFGPLIRWVGQKNIGTGASHYILLQRTEKNPVTQLPLIHLRCDSFDDIPRFLKDLLDPAQRREGLITELPIDRERRRIHDWLAPLNQSEFLNDMSNLQGPNRFDRQVTQSHNIWAMNQPSRVRVRGEAGFGKTMLCTSVIQHTLKDCRLGNASRGRDSLAYFFCVTYKPWTDNPSLRFHDFNAFLRTVISQLTPPDVVFPTLRALYSECTRYHPGRLPTSEELQVVLIQILWHLDKPPAPRKGDPITPGETYLVIDELEALEPNARSEYSKFIKLVASQPFEHFHLLVSAHNPLTVGIDPPSRPMSSRGRRKRRRSRRRAMYNMFGSIPASVTAITNWAEVTLDWSSTSTALLEWLRDRFLNDPSLAPFANVRQDVILMIQQANENLRWVHWKLNKLCRVAADSSLDDDALKVAAEAVLQADDTVSGPGSSFDTAWNGGGSNRDDDDDTNRLEGRKRTKTQRIGGRKRQRMALTDARTG
ncbi:SIR2-like domain-containing protein [Hypoxylon argillaceum]|nr:SIR2-like domain-containing protein [Hypoxylon argillaceum]